jgi:hypothetical protein
MPHSQRAISAHGASHTPLHALLLAVTPRQASQAPDALHCSATLQVRCFVGDNEQRWFMWYSGRTEGGHELDALTPASGKIGACWHHSAAAYHALAARTSPGCSAQMQYLQ